MVPPPPEAFEEAEAELPSWLWLATLVVLAVLAYAWSVRLLAASVVRLIHVGRVRSQLRAGARYAEQFHQGVHRENVR